MARGRKRRMGAATLGLLTVGLVAGAPVDDLAHHPSGDAPEVIEVVEVRYSSAAPGLASTSRDIDAYAFDCDLQLGCAAATVPTGANLAMVEVVDDHAPLTMGVVALTDQRFCGQTTEPVATEQGTRFEVHLLSGECDGQPTLATSGIVRITFSHRPDEDA